MRVVVQRVRDAKCVVDNKITGQIDKGFMLLVGFSNEDTLDVLPKMVKKVQGLRIFEDENGKMNKSLHDVGGSILSISQFTLYADASGGYRPSFVNAMKGEQAVILYNKFNDMLKEYGLNVQTGVFGAMMDIEFVNVGPTTILLDSQNL